MSIATDLHGHFIASLGDRQLTRYSDGGPTDRGRAERRKKGKAARLARRRNRRSR